MVVGLGQRGVTGEEEYGPGKARRSTALAVRSVTLLFFSTRS